MKAITKKVPKELKLGYLHQYRAAPTVKDVDFARLHQIKLVTNINVYSRDLQHNDINRFLSNRGCLPDDNEIKYLMYKFDEVTPLNKNLDSIRRAQGWAIEKDQDQLIIEGNKVDFYNCFTTLGHLKFLRDKYHPKAWIFSSHSKGSIDPGGKYYKLKVYYSYTGAIKQGKLIVFDPFLAEQCIRLAKKLGHTIQYIYDEYFIPNYETLDKKKRTRKHIEGVPRLLFESDPERQKLVCITDGITVTRIKKYKAEKLLIEFPTMSYCEKYVYHQYLKELGKSKVTKLFEHNPDGTRKQRRLHKQKRKLYSRKLQSQFIPNGEHWILDKDGINEDLMPFPSRTILHRIKDKKDTPKTVEHHTRDRKERLMRKYREVFAGQERRNDKFSSSEKWSYQFMDLLAMVRKDKPKREIALKLATIFPGWNDKQMSRFIKYLQLTKHGLNYKLKKETTPIKRVEKVETEVQGIKISKLPYGKDIAVEYKTTDKDGAVATKIEQNVKVQQKKIVRYDKESKGTVEICSIGSITKWVMQENYKEKDCPWIDFITVVPYKKITLHKIPFHLPDKKKKINKWKHPIKDGRIKRIKKTG
jgi:hypothetical protein